MIFRPEIYAVVFFGFLLLFWLVLSLLPISSGLSAILMAAAGAALIEGRAYSERKSQSPLKSSMWKAAFGMALINAGVTVGSAAVFTWLFFAKGTFEAFGSMGWAMLFGLFSITFVLSVFVTRFGYGMGITRGRRIGRQRRK